MLLTPLSISLLLFSESLCLLSLTLSFSLSELWEIETLTFLLLYHVHKYSWEMKTCSLCNSHLSQAHTDSWEMKTLSPSHSLYALTLSLSLKFSLYALSLSPSHFLILSLCSLLSLHLYLSLFFVINCMTNDSIML